MGAYANITDKNKVKQIKHSLYLKNFNLAYKQHLKCHMKQFVTHQNKSCSSNPSKSKSELSSSSKSKFRCSSPRLSSSRDGILSDARSSSLPSSLLEIPQYRNARMMISSSMLSQALLIQLSRFSKG